MLWATNEPATGKQAGAYIQYVEADENYFMYALDSNDKTNTDMIFVCEGKFKLKLRI